MSMALRPLTYLHSQSISLKKLVVIADGDGYDAKSCWHQFVSVHCTILCHEAALRVSFVYHVTGSTKSGLRFSEVAHSLSGAQLGRHLLQGHVSK